MSEQPSEHPPEFGLERIQELRSNLTGAYEIKVKEYNIPEEGFLENLSPVRLPLLNIATSECQYDTLQPHVLDCREYSHEEVLEALRTPIGITVHFREGSAMTLNIKLDGPKWPDDIHILMGLPKRGKIN